MKVQEYEQSKIGLQFFDMWYLAVNGSRAVHPPEHTAGYDTIFVQIYMDPPPGVPGMSKNWIFFFTNKTIKIEIFFTKTLVF